MKILVISNGYPLPEDHGTNMRTMNFVRYFQKYGSIDLAYKKQKPLNCNSTNVFSREHYIEQRQTARGDRNSLKKRLSRFLRRLPWYIDESALKAGEQIVELIKSGTYDVVLVRYIHNTANLNKLPEAIRTRVVVDFDDFISDSLYETYSSKDDSLYSKLRRKVDRAFLKNYEERCLDFGAVLFCSEDDRRKMNSRRKSRNCYVVPNIYQNEAFSSYNFYDGSMRTQELLFVGTLVYRPNIDGLIWFIEHIFPALRAVNSAVTLHVAGRSPSEALRKKIAECPGVELHADMPDLRPYYEACGVIIVPLLSGGGTRIKILEAGLANRPVLSTPLGAYGLDLQDGKDVLLFTNKDTFLSQYARLSDRQLYTSLANNLQYKVMTEYSAANFDSAMNNVLQAIVNH